MVPTVMMRNEQLRALFPSWPIRGCVRYFKVEVIEESMNYLYTIQSRGSSQRRGVTSSSATSAKKGLEVTWIDCCGYL